MRMSLEESLLSREEKVNVKKRASRNQASDMPGVGSGCIKNNNLNNLGSREEKKDKLMSAIQPTESDGLLQTPQSESRIPSTPGDGLTDLQSWLSSSGEGLDTFLKTKKITRDGDCRNVNDGGVGTSDQPRSVWRLSGRRNISRLITEKINILSSILSRSQLSKKICRCLNGTAVIVEIIALIADSYNLWIVLSRDKSNQSLNPNNNIINDPDDHLFSLEYHDDFPCLVMSKSMSATDISTTNNLLCSNSVSSYALTISCAVLFFQLCYWSLVYLPVLIVRSNSSEFDELYLADEEDDTTLDHNGEYSHLLHNNNTREIDNSEIDLEGNNNNDSSDNLIDGSDDPKSSKQLLLTSSISDDHNLTDQNDMNFDHNIHINDDGNGILDKTLNVSTESDCYRDISDDLIDEDKQSSSCLLDDNNNNHQPSLTRWPMFLRGYPLVALVNEVTSSLDFWILVFALLDLIKHTYTDNGLLALPLHTTAFKLIRQILLYCAFLIMFLKYYKLSGQDVFIDKNDRDELLLRDPFEDDDGDVQISDNEISNSTSSVDLENENKKILILNRNDNRKEDRGGRKSLEGEVDRTLNFSLLSESIGAKNEIEFLSH